MRMSGRHTWLAVAILASLGSTGSVHAEPLDLTNRTSRDVLVRFETSSRATPAALDHTYTDPVPARFEPGPDGHVLVVIQGSYVAQYLFAGQEVVGDSFSDFVWTFDSQTGDVIDARFGGEIVQWIDWGFGASATRARIHVRMSTRELAGFRERLNVLGNLVFRYCDPAIQSRSRCNAVDPVRFNRRSGYVNAVGAIDVETVVGIGTTSFSPLGEAIFLEQAILPIDAESQMASMDSLAESTAPVE